MLIFQVNFEGTPISKKLVLSPAASLPSALLRINGINSVEGSVLQGAGNGEKFFAEKNCSVEEMIKN